ncbi:MAG TPA: thiopurine S-methyltransferase [Candidatus Luteimonas excrementigallinarum]|nr:thiopurine S-methyltransferase [Candidatus Luteimonas excrementigallinarum]
MEPDFWHERWQDGRIGFHQAQPLPLLCKHWPALSLAAGSRVFVPLCGKSVDMAWLAGQGHRVLGVELSGLAVQQFFDERGLSPSKRDTRLGTHYSAGPYELICGDAFALDEATLADCAAVYDRAALIALPPPLRERYAATTWQRLPAGCEGLLITLEYPQAQKAGPPFSVEEAEVRGLLEPGWAVSVRERRDILADEPRFAEAGVTSLHTTVYTLSRR